MINKIITFISKARTFLQGKKTYLAATILFLQALLGYIEQSLAVTNLADFVTWLKALPTSESTMQLASALGLFGIRAAMSSKTVQTASGAQESSSSSAAAQETIK